MTDNKHLDILIETLPDVEEDTFESSKVAKSVAETIIKNRPPFVYAICANWGAGKSSFLKFMIDYFPTIDNKKSPGIIAYFNAWKASMNTDILFSFIYEIFTQLKEGKAFRNKKLEKQALKNSIDILIDEAGKFLRSKVSIVAPLMQAYRKSAGFIDKDMIDDMGSANRLRKTFEEVCSSLKNVTVYVIIDEIDRCTPHDVVKIIESIRILFFGSDELELKIKHHNTKSKNKPKQLRIPFKFILSYDENYVVKAFKEYYRFSELNESFHYLSKFIQFKYHLTKRNWQEYILTIIKNYAYKFEYYPQGSEKDINNVIQAMNISNPRSVRQVLNYLIEWQRRLYSEHSDQKLQFEKNIIKKFQNESERSALLRAANCYLVIVACVKVEYPAFIDFIIGKDCLHELPYINTTKHQVKELLHLFVEGSIAANGVTDKDSDGLRKKLGQDKASFLSLLWEALGAIDSCHVNGAIDVGDKFSDVIHNGIASKFLSIFFIAVFKN